MNQIIVSNGAALPVPTKSNARCDTELACGCRIILTLRHYGGVVYITEKDFCIVELVRCQRCEDAHRPDPSPPTMTDTKA